MEINSNFKVEEVLDIRTTSLVTFVNPFSYYMVKDSSSSAEFDYIYSDAISFVKVYNFFNWKNKIKRYSFDFTSLALVVFKHAQDNDLNVGLVGGNQEEIELAIKSIKSKFNNLKIVYYRNGYFNNQDEMDKSCSKMNESQVNILVCGMGTPRQEDFLINAKNKVNSLSAGFTCGGFLSQIANRVDYFNPLMSKLHLRWLQRFSRHSYVRKRLLKDYPIFFTKFIYQSIKEKLI